MYTVQKQVLLKKLSTKNLPQDVGTPDTEDIANKTAKLKIMSKIADDQLKTTQPKLVTAMQNGSKPKRHQSNEGCLNDLNSALAKISAAKSGLQKLQKQEIATVKASDQRAHAITSQMEDNHQVYQNTTNMKQQRQNIQLLKS